MNNNFDKDNVVYYLPIIGALSLIFRAVIPFQLYLFGISTTVFLLLYLYQSGIKVFFSMLINIMKQAKLLFIVAIIYLLVLILSFNKNPLIYRELFRVVSVLLIYFQFYFLVNKKGISFLIDIFLNTYLIYISVFFSILFSQIITKQEFTSILLEYDYNMIALYLILSVIIILNRIVLTQKKVRIVFLNIFLFLFSLLIILTSSRRGVIILSISLIVYFFLSKRKYGKYLKNIKIYLFLFLTTLFIVVYILTDSNLRYYTIHNIHNENIKIQVISISNRLSSILGVDNKKISFFKVKPGYLFVRKKIEKDLEKNHFTFNKLNDLAMFSRSKEYLKRYYPDVFLIPDSVFQKNYITDIPATFNVDYTFFKVFKPIGFYNCVITEFYPDNNVDSMFVFTAINNKQESQIMSLLPISDSSLFELNFRYLTDEDISVKFDILNNSIASYVIVSDTTINIENRIKQKKIVLRVLSTTSNNLKIIIQFNKHLIMSDVVWERHKTSVSLVHSLTKPQERFLLRDKYIINLLNNNLVDVDSTISVYDIYKYHDSMLLTTIFSKYISSDILLSNIKRVEFNSQGNLSLVRKIIPAFPNTNYSISFITNIKPDLLYFYTKRYPEVNPNYLQIKELKRKTERMNNNEFFVKDSFYVASSNSLQSLFIVGSKRGGDSLFIKDFTCKYYKSNNIILSSEQKKHINYIKGNQKIIINNKNIRVKDSLVNIYNMQFSDDNNLFKARKDRWIFSFRYFVKLPFYQKIFGDKLNYLSVFPSIMYISNKEKLEYDYPHNPVISTFLYSGVIGGLLYLWFLIIIIYLFIVNRKKLGLIPVLFVISFIFAFFSGNSHFSIPVFAILSLFPFLYDKDKV